MDTFHPIEFLAADLAGHIVVSDNQHVQPTLCLFAADDMSENYGYCPAKSFAIYGIERLEKLRDALLHVVPLKEENP